MFLAKHVHGLKPTTHASPESSFEQRPVGARLPNVSTTMLNRNRWLTRKSEKNACTLETRCIDASDRASSGTINGGTHDN